MDLQISILAALANGGELSSSDLYRRLREEDQHTSIAGMFVYIEHLEDAGNVTTRRDPSTATPMLKQGILMIKITSGGRRKLIEAGSKSDVSFGKPALA